MGCYFPGWGVIKPDGVLVNGKGCYKTGCGVSERDGVFVYSMRC